MTQPRMDNDFQNRIQRILNDKKKEDLRKQAVIGHERPSELKLTRSIYGGWDVIQANIPGWAFQKKE